MNVFPSRYICLVFAASIGIAFSSTAAQADEKSRALLRNAESILLKAHSIQAEILDLDPSAPGASMFRALRPGHFTLSGGAGVGKRTMLVGNGDRVIECDEAHKTGNTLDWGTVYSLGNEVPMLFLMTTFLEPALLPQMEGPVYGGSIKRNGKTFQIVKCTATSERSKWTLFFDSHGALAGVESEAFHAGKSVAPAQRAWLRNVRLNIPVTAGEFIYAPPSETRIARSDSPVCELPPVHSPAPHFAMPTVDGKHVTLESMLKGKKALLLTITFQECGACILEVPTLKRLYAGLKDKGLAMLAVNILDTRELARRVVDKYRLPYPVGLDNKAGGGSGDVGTRYRADAGGLNILIGPDDKIVWEEAGLNEKHLRCVLEHMGISAVSR